MKNYTEIFSQALKMKEGYDVKKLKKIIDSQNEFHCGDYDEWADNYWYMLTPQQMKSYDEYYGYLSLEYPIALLSENCPDKLNLFFPKTAYCIHYGKNRYHAMKIY